MPDKEFDKLFKDKFADAEIEPSANLWANIESELEPKRKRIFPIYWMAAASVAIAITAMLVFQKEDVIELHGPNQMANVTAPKVEIIDGTSTTVIAPATTAIESAAPAHASLVSNKGVNTSKKTTAENNIKNIPVDVQPKEEFAHLPIKKADPITIDVTPKQETIVGKGQEVMIADAGTKTTIETPSTEIENTTERKGIRNVGDLVNFVVDKVDKRDKKILKFNTDDDDESSLIGINIGFVKLNRKHK